MGRGSSTAGVNGRVITGIMAGLIFVLAGWLSISAAQLRWGDACAGGFDESSCVLIQDHLYDFVLPVEPWVPIAGAAELAGLSYILVALALGLVFATVRSSWWSRLLQSLLVLSALMFGVTTLLSGRAGVPVEPATSIAAWWMFALTIGGLMLLVALIGLDSSGPGADSLLPPIAWVVWAGLLLLAAPLPEYIWISVLLGYTSHDTTPWTGAGAGVLVALAGLVLIAGVIRNAVRKTRRVQAAAR